MMIPLRARLLLCTALLVLGSCGGGDDDPPVGGGTIMGQWQLQSIEGANLPTLYPRTTLLVDHATANFGDPQFTMTYAGTFEGEPQNIVVNGTWSRDGGVYRLSGSVTINGVYADGYNNGMSVNNGVLTGYGSPAEVWVR